MNVSFVYGDRESFDTALDLLPDTAGEKDMHRLLIFGAKGQIYDRLHPAVREKATIFECTPRDIDKHIVEIALLPDIILTFIEVVQGLRDITMSPYFVHPADITHAENIWHLNHAGIPSIIVPVSLRETIREQITRYQLFRIAA